jgi:hypothetical protein
MRVAMFALVALGGLAGCSGMKNDLQDPSSKFRAFSGHGSMQQIHGDLQGMRPDPITGMPAPAGVPYTERVFDFGLAAEMWPSEPTMLGTDVGMMFGVHMGYVSAGEVDGMAVQGAFLPLTMGLSMGTGLAVLRRPGLLIALHSSLKLEMGPDRLGKTGESWLAIYGGVRGYYDTGRLRTRVQYDFLPFWAGESRLEHRLTGLVSTHREGDFGYGIRAGLEIGQKRLPEGGLDDVSFTLGVEVER